MLGSLTKKRSVVALGAVLVLALAGGAVAYFSSSGSGSGSASVGTSTAFQIAGTTSGALYPGQSSTVTFSVTNPGGGSQQLGTISLTGVKACSAGSTWSVANSNCGSGTEVTGCETSTQTASSNSADFSMANVAENQVIPAGATYGSGGSGSLTSGTGTLTMNDLSSSQDLCKGVSLYLQFSS
jgi:hypothetical protein